MRYLKLPAPFQDYFQANPYHETLDCVAVFLHALTYELNALFADPTADPRVIEQCLRKLLAQQHLDGFDAVPLPDFLQLLHQPHWRQAPWFASWIQLLALHQLVPSEDVLTYALHETCPEVQRAALALCRHSTTSNARICQRIETLAFQSSTLTVRAEAITQLRQTQVQQHLHTLEAVFRSDPNPTLRRAALWALAKASNKERLLLLCEWAHRDPSFEVQGLVSWLFKRFHLKAQAPLLFAYLPGKADTFEERVLTLQRLLALEALDCWPHWHLLRDTLYTHQPLPIRKILVKALLHHYPEISKMHLLHWIQETPELILDVIRELKVLGWREVPDTWLELEEKYTREGAEVLPTPHAADWWEFA